MSKETFLRDEDGDYKMWVDPVFTVMIITGFFLLSIGIITVLIGVGDYYEVNAFNRIHGTDYSFAEWFWAGMSIKEYHLGSVENKNYQVDLNINDPEKFVNGK